MKKLNTLLIISLTILISACNKNIKEYTKCRAAADAIGDYKAVRIINKKFDENNMQQYLPKNSFEMYQMIQDIKDELGLLDPPTMVTKFRLVKAFNSCTDIHEQEKYPAPRFTYYIMYPFL